MSTTSTPPLVDVRPDLAAGREPFSKIMQTARTIGEGRSFLLLSPIEPEPLYGVLGRMGFTHETESLGDDGFRVTFTRQGVPQ